MVCFSPIGIWCLADVSSVSTQQYLLFFLGGGGTKYFGGRFGVYQFFWELFQITSNPHSTYFMAAPLRSEQAESRLPVASC